MAITQSSDEEAKVPGNTTRIVQVSKEALAALFQTGRRSNMLISKGLPKNSWPGFAYVNDTSGNLVMTWLADNWPEGSGEPGSTIHIEERSFCCPNCEDWK